MRKIWQKQIPLMAHIQDHEQNQELMMISSIIESNPTICQHILQDLNKGKLVFKRAGADGMSADQVLRCAVIKTLFNPLGLYSPPLAA